MPYASCAKHELVGNQNRFELRGHYGKEDDKAKNGQMITCATTKPSSDLMIGVHVARKAANNFNKER
jgi:hypothetical protein